MFFGWYVVAACTLITLYTGGVVNFGFTAIFDPLAKQFGWSYVQISAAASLRALETGLLSAVVGLLVNRVGPRRLIFTGIALIFLGYMLLSRVASLGMYYGAFALISLGMVSCTGTVLFTPVTHWFSKKVGLAVGIVSAGFGMGGLLVPLVAALISRFHWQTAMVIIGVGALVVCLPLAALVRHRPEDYGYLPDGDIVEPSPKESAAPAAPTVTRSVTIRQALRDRPFWHISLSSMCHSFVVGAVVAHIMPYLISVGVDTSTSSMIALVLPVSSVVARLSGGFLNGKFGNRTMYSASLLLMTTGLLIFSYVTDAALWLVIGFVFAFGLGWGFSMISRLTLLREYYGRETFGALVGFTSAIMMFGNMSGAPLAGWTYDRYGSYHGAWLAFAGVTFGGMLLALTIPSRRLGKQAEPAAQDAGS